MYSATALAGVLAFSSCSVAADCFFPNGDISKLDTVCSPNALVSTCCFDGQACLSNGLCVSDPHNGTVARLHRGTCTDKDWKSGNCVRQCLDLGGNGAPVYSCNSTTADSYCCHDNCKCDNNQFESFSFPEQDVYTLTIIGESFTQTHTSSASSTSTPSASASTTPASNAAATTTSTNTPLSNITTESDSLKKTAIGVGVGVGVGVSALVLTGIALLFWRRKKRNNSHGAPANRKPAELENTGYYPPTEKYAHYADSLTSSAQRSTGPPPVELAGERVLPAELSDSSPLPRDNKRGFF